MGRPGLQEGPEGLGFEGAEEAAAAERLEGAGAEEGGGEGAAGAAGRSHGLERKIKNKFKKEKKKFGLEGTKKKIPKFPKFCS